MATSPSEADIKRVFDDETWAAVRLFEHGLTRLVSSTAWHFDAPTVMTCLASGLERMLKLSIGSARHSNAGLWPGDEIKRQRHHLRQLLGLTGEVISDALQADLGSPYIGGLQELANTHQVSDDLIGCLDAWAESTGRYWNLNALAGTGQGGASPIDAWEAIDRDVAAQLGLISDLASLTTHSIALRAVRSNLAAAVMLPWHLHHRAWQKGIFGPLARQHSAALNVYSTRPDLPPDTLQDARRLLAILDDEATTTTAC